MFVKQVLQKCNLIVIISLMIYKLYQEVTL